MCPTKTLDIAPTSLREPSIGNSERGRGRGDSATSEKPPRQESSVARDGHRVKMRLFGPAQVCEHNTAGAQCNECAVGYYGDAVEGTPEDCRRCACPLEESTNNFSPACRADDAYAGGYVCTECPDGYAGDHCEMYAGPRRGPGQRQPSSGATVPGTAEG